MVGRNPNAPAGVVRSPSCLFGDVPRCPSQGVHGPAAGFQQAPGLRQSRSEPCVEERRGATTVTSSRAAPVDASSFARFAGQPVVACRAPAAPEATQSGRQARSAIHLIVRADYVAVKLLLIALFA